MLKTWIINTTSVLTFFALTAYINENVEPFHRGFFCSDQSIRYPYRSSTVSNELLQFGSNIVPILVIILVEFRIWQSKKTRDEQGLLSVLAPILSITLTFLFGSAATSFLTDLSKATIGRLRPNFIDVCRPEFSNIDCGDYTNPVYIDDYVCMGNPLFGDQHAQMAEVQDARRSFVSGHSSVSFQGMTFIILYLHLRLQKTGGLRDFAVASVQILCFAFAFFTAMSRVSDNKHNPSDVLAGSILGIALQALNVKHLLKPQLRAINDDNEVINDEQKGLREGPKYASIDVKREERVQLMEV